VELISKFDAWLLNCIVKTFFFPPQFWECYIMTSILGAWSPNRKRIAQYSFFACIAMQAYSTKLAYASEPDERTLSVLKREADGQVWDRATELSTTDSDRSNLSHWVSGEVFVAGKWTPVNELENIQISDQTKEYLRHRGTEPLDESAHRKLAKWCETKSLEEQRMSHWHGVLEFNEQDIEARRKLGFIRVGTKWFSKAEYDQTSILIAKRFKDLTVWMPKMQSIALAICSSDIRKKTKAIEDLRAVKDEESIQAMYAVAMQLEGDYARPFVTAIRKFKSKEACLALAKVAISNPTSVAGQEAIAGLKSYRQDFYVSDALSLIEDDAEMKQSMIKRPNGDLVIEQSLLTESLDEKSLKVFSKVLAMDSGRFPSGAMRRGGVRGVVGFASNPAKNETVQKVVEKDAEIQMRRDQQTFERHNAAKRELKENVIQVLEQTTDASPGTTADSWWQWWDIENDSNKMSAKRYTGEYQQFYDRAYQARLITPATPPRYECLVAGTPIQTQNGLRAVESIRTGDLVLANEVESGSLEFRPVIKTTIRPPTDTMKIVTNDETIQATLGHYWWVAGQGWLRTKELQPGMKLHTATGTIQINEVLTVEEKLPTYNLVVDVTHTYFVGKNRVLSNDATDVRATTTRVPGLSEPAVATHVASK